MQAGYRPMVVIKNKNNSLLIIKLQSNAVRGDEVSSFDSKEISNFSAEADLFTTFCVTFDAVLPPFLVTFPLKKLSFVNFRGLIPA